MTGFTSHMAENKLAIGEETLRALTELNIPEDDLHKPMVLVVGNLMGVVDVQGFNDISEGMKVVADICRVAPFTIGTEDTTAITQCIIMGREVILQPVISAIALLTPDGKFAGSVGTVDLKLPEQEPLEETSTE